MAGGGEAPPPDSLHPPKLPVVPRVFGYHEDTGGEMAFKPTREQQKVLDHDHRLPARLLAGPGTGKSATVVHYIHQLHSLKKKPKMRLLTFTRAATSEIAANGGEDRLLKPPTVHSLPISVL